MTSLLVYPAIAVGIAVVAFGVALGLVASPAPPMPPLQDVFGFSDMKREAPTDQPALQRYGARDGEQLAFRLYESSSSKILVFVHGSSYHGGGYHKLAQTLAAAGIAKVVLPNLRGHYMSGARRGDVDYIGQLEDDVADLIAHVRTQGLTGPVTLGGHSSGCGFALRFAGCTQAGLVSNYLLLAPIIPVSPAIRGGNAGGWSIVHLRRLFGLLFLNTVGISGFNSLPVIRFNKPASFWDGTETLAYSYALNTSYHPRYRYQADLKALPAKVLVLVGENDQAIDGRILQTLFAADAPAASVKILPGIDHFGVFSDAAALQAAADWMKGP